MDAEEFSSTRLVYYSLSFDEAEPRPDLLWQLETSLSSLRAHNRRLPVIIFLHGMAPPRVEEIAREQGAAVHHKQPYAQSLAELSPSGWKVLSRYPLLHKFLNFSDIARLDPQPDQVLFLDCDTLFLDDPERLFDQYQGAHVVAREEVNSRRSHYGYEPSYLSEESLDKLAVGLGAHSVAPFNLGVVLFNGGSWTAMASLEPVLIAYAWRFMVWMALTPAAGSVAAYGELGGIDLIRRRQVHVDDIELKAALPYPSTNRWILDEVAMWLALGHFQDLVMADFSVSDVLQNGEFTGHLPASGRAVVCHYFSQNMSRIHSWLDERAQLWLTST